MEGSQIKMLFVVYNPHSKQGGKFCREVAFRSHVSILLVSKSLILESSCCNVPKNAFFVLLFFQLAPVGVVRPSDVLQQHPHSAAGLQPARSSLPHRRTPHTPGARPTSPVGPAHTFSHPPLHSPSVPRSALHDRHALPLPTQPLKQTCLQM